MPQSIDPRVVIVMAAPFFLAITCHEVAHGYVASLLGDPTAKLRGRLTLNPIKHFDLMGSLAFIMTALLPGGFIFGWAKPVPVDPRYFKNPRRDMMLVAAAGPAVNIVLAVLFSFAYKALVAYAMQDVAASQASMIIPPLISMLEAGVVINLILCVFNLLPLPPLDGSNIVAGFLSPRAADSFMRFGRWGFLIIIALAIFGVLGYVIGPPMRYLYGLLI